MPSNQKANQIGTGIERTDANPWTSEDPVLGLSLALSAWKRLGLAMPKEKQEATVYLSGQGKISAWIIVPEFLELK